MFCKFIFCELSLQRANNSGAMSGLEVIGVVSTIAKVVIKIVD